MEKRMKAFLLLVMNYSLERSTNGTLFSVECAFLHLHTEEEDVGPWDCILPSFAERLLLITVPYNDNMMSLANTLLKAFLLPPRLPMEKCKYFLLLHGNARHGCSATLLKLKGIGFTTSTACTSGVYAVLTEYVLCSYSFSAPYFTLCSPSSPSSPPPPLPSTRDSKQKGKKKVITKLLLLPATMYYVVDDDMMMVVICTYVLVALEKNKRMKLFLGILT